MQVGWLGLRVRDIRDIIIIISIMVVVVVVTATNGAII